mgnify:CR=1 FL=1
MCKIRVAFNLLVIVAVLLCPEEIPNQQSDYDYKGNIIPRIHIREKLGAFLIEHSESHERSDHDCQSNNTDFLLFVYFELLSIFSLFIFLIYLRFFICAFANCRSGKCGRPPAYGRHNLPNKLRIKVTPNHPRECFKYNTAIVSNIDSVMIT